MSSSTASLREELKKSLVEAAKAKDQLRLDAVRSVQSAIRYKEIEKRSELADAEILSVIGTLCKQRRESIDQFKKGGRQDLADKESKELAVLEKFLPAQLSKEEIEKTVAKAISDLGVSGPSAMGQVMKEAMARMAGQADGKVVNEIVRSLLKS